MLTYLLYPSPVRRVGTGLILLLALGCGALFAADTLTDPALRWQWYDQHVTLKQQSIFGNLPWQFLGPTNISGRMTDVDVVAPKGKNYTIYVAGASGGVWKTVNEGTTWEPVFEHAPSTSIGDVTLAPSNPDIIWVGTGEANIFRSSHAGCGVFKSVDAGKTWQHMGLTDTNTIPRIVIHPEYPNVVYVAASGHEWTPNAERGVFKTIDGGQNWEKILYIDEMTGAIDLVMDPASPDTLYATTWQRVRKKWNDPRNEPDYGNSGIYKTVDGGRAWVQINNGLPEARYRGRIGIDLCRTHPEILYAFVDNYDILRAADPTEETDSYGRPRGDVIKGATVYRSDDGGANWRQVSEADDYMASLSATYGWVFGQIRVDPVNPDRIYVMGLALNVSDDGGKTFRPLRGMHGDHHGLWIDPENTDYLINVNDGGVVISYDAGANWKHFLDNLPLVQFFNVSHDMDNPFHVYGSIQDHGSYRGTVDLGNGRDHIPAGEWERAPGGEGSCHAIDPTNPDIVYSAGFYGTISRTNIRTDESTIIVPRPAKGEPPYRGQWLAPFILSPHNPRILYHGMNFLFRSLHMGESWEKISPDLTYNNPDRLGDIQYQTIFTISESPLKFGLIYAGTDDGRAHVTRDGGRNWQEITFGLEPYRWISRVVASAYDEGTVYLTQNGKRDDDFAAYIWKSTDYGETWVSITNNLPCGPVNVIREDPRNKNILYVGTDLGVYASLNGGATWHALPGKLPTTFVHDLVIHPEADILVAATHGRGMYALNVRHLQQMDMEFLRQPVHLFAPEPAKVPQRRWWRFAGGRDATFHYYLNQAQDVVIRILDAEKNAVKEMTVTADRGYNLAAWDLRKADAGEASRRRSPFVEAGTYTVELTAGGQTVTAELKVTE
ncbi:MAG: hypothetical protein JXQ27_16300 [Acidobacteria bacterium]|nr:hypothetical protein [Acidobacteriota bacterium]